MTSFELQHHIEHLPVHLAIDGNEKLIPRFHCGVFNKDAKSRCKELITGKNLKNLHHCHGKQKGNISVLYPYIFKEPIAVTEAFLETELSICFLAHKGTLISFDFNINSGAISCRTRTETTTSGICNENKHMKYVSECLHAACQRTFFIRFMCQLPELITQMYHAILYLLNMKYITYVWNKRRAEKINVLVGPLCERPRRYC